MVGDIWSQKQEVTNIETITTPLGTKDASLYLGPVISFHREAEAPGAFMSEKPRSFTQETRSFKPSDSMGP